jgi:hypothetical protein
LVSLAAITLLTACASAPDAQVSEARQLIDAVIADGGQDFAPDVVASLNKRYEDAITEIQYQNGLIFKNYSMATFTLNQVMDDCDDLKAKIAKSRGIEVAAVPKRIKFAN